MKINKFVLWLILATFPASLAFAKSKETKDVTGCLSKGDSASEFVLTASDGSTWEVKSSKVALADHVGHTVTATGTVSSMKEDAKEAANDAGMKNDSGMKKGGEAGHLTVTDVKMVSDSCK